MRLGDWLDRIDRAGTREYPVVDLSETAPRPEDLVAYLATLMGRAKMDPAHVDRLAEMLGWGAIRARLTPGSQKVSRGEFGEALATAILEETEGWVVPITKLRYQIDPEQTLPGTDLLALRLANGEVVDLHFAESKLRGERDNRAAVDAHDQLREDQAKGFADILVFVLERLLEQQSPLIDPLGVYLTSREENEPGSYGIFLTFEEVAWREEVLDRLDETDPLLDPLAVRVTRIAGLRTLADQACAEAGLAVVDDDD